MESFYLVGVLSELCRLSADRLIVVSCSCNDLPSIYAVCYYDYGIGDDKGSCSPEHGREKGDIQNMQGDTACNGQPTMCPQMLIDS